MLKQVEQEVKFILLKLILKYIYINIKSNKKFTFSRRKQSLKIL